MHVRLDIAPPPTRRSIAPTTFPLQKMNIDYVLIGLSGITFLVATVGAWYAFRAFRLKAGIEIRGSYSTTSSIASEDQYVSSVTLENTKDRAVTVFEILFVLDRGYFISLERFEDAPLIIPPFGVVHRNYEPIDRYSAGLRRIRLDKLFENRGVRRRLVLSTSVGRYDVAAGIERWYPVTDFFKNAMTAHILPLRSIFQGKAFGSGTKYIVKLTTSSGSEELIPVYARDHHVQKFRRFRLTAGALSSRDALEEFLLERAIAGELNCRDVEVFDAAEWRRDFYDTEDRAVIEAEPQSWFGYTVLGPVLTRIDNYRLKRKNLLG